MKTPYLVLMLGMFFLISCQNVNTQVEKELATKKLKSNSDACSGAINHQRVSGRAGYAINSWSNCDVLGGQIKFVASANGCCSSNNQTWPVSISYEKPSGNTVLQVNRYNFTARPNDSSYEVVRSDDGKELYFKFNVERRDDTGKYLRVKAGSWFYVIDK